MFNKVVETRETPSRPASPGHRESPPHRNVAKRTYESPESDRKVAQRSSGSGCGSVPLRSIAL
jgi:hypothetical protein